MYRSANDGCKFAAFLPRLRIQSKSKPCRNDAAVTHRGGNSEVQLVNREFVMEPRVYRCRASHSECELAFYGWTMAGIGGAGRSGSTFRAKTPYGNLVNH